MPAPNEDTFALMCLIGQNSALYDDCFRIAAQTLERLPPRGNASQGVGVITATARSELSGLLRNVLQYSDDTAVQEHIADASVDWRDVARAFIADILCRNDA